MTKQYNAYKCTCFLYQVPPAIYPLVCSLVPQNKRGNLILSINKRGLRKIHATKFTRDLVAVILPSRAVKGTQPVFEDANLSGRYNTVHKNIISHNIFMNCIIISQV